MQDSDSRRWTCVRARTRGKPQYIRFVDTHRGLHHRRDRAQNTALRLWKGLVLPYGGRAW
jgi:hypothetical protein